MDGLKQLFGMVNTNLKARITIKPNGDESPRKFGSVTLNKT